MELPPTTTSPDHIDFDQMCSQVDDFEPLPTVTAADLEAEQADEEESPFDAQILAGLVVP